MMLNKKKCRTLWKSAFAHLMQTEPDVLQWARGTGKNTFRALRAKAFLRQYCFVVYASGFRYHTIKARFPDLGEAFHDFDLERLCKMRSLKPVLKVFGNERKASNFLDGAKAIANEGFPAFKKRLALGGPDVLTELPGIGPITQNHLAKNIGLSDVAKADVWLVRAANQCGAATVNEFIDFLHDESGESRHVVDVVLWTYARDGKLPGYARTRQAATECTGS
jgi:hypothetical protein